MPKIDAHAKSWEMDVAERVGRAVRRRRVELKLSGQQLADRTVETGYPITRVAISKIETNSRSGKLDVAELMVLAAAMDIAPVTLLFPDMPDGMVAMLPGEYANSLFAVHWFCGERYRFQSAASDFEVKGSAALIAAARDRQRLLVELMPLQRLMDVLDMDEVQRQGRLDEIRGKMAELESVIRNAGGVVGDIE